MKASDLDKARTIMSTIDAIDTFAGMAFEGTNRRVEIVIRVPHPDRPDEQEPKWPHQPSISIAEPTVPTEHSPLAPMLMALRDFWVRELEAIGVTLDQRSKLFDYRHPDRVDEEPGVPV